MKDAYLEYLELYEYFGRGGLVRLQRAEFEVLSQEFTQLLDLRPELSRAQAERVRELRTLLFRDRPRLSEL